MRFIYHETQAKLRKNTWQIKSLVLSLHQVNVYLRIDPSNHAVLRKKWKKLGVFFGGWGDTNTRKRYIYRIYKRFKQHLKGWDNTKDKLISRSKTFFEGIFRECRISFKWWIRILKFKTCTCNDRIIKDWKILNANH